MLATTKSHSSRTYGERWPIPAGRFDGIRDKRLPIAINKNSGSVHDLSRGHEESPTVGFLLLDAAFRPIYASKEALAILAYPGIPSTNKSFEDFLQNRIRSLLPDVNHNGSSPHKFLNEVASGKRCYRLRAFSVKSRLGVGRRPAVALLLERNQPSTLNIESVARKFRLTPREMETVELLLQDLSTKQIASRMEISPNTVKVFLKSVMAKVGAENRTGIIGRILQVSKAMNGESLF